MHYIIKAIREQSKIELAIGCPIFERRVGSDFIENPDNREIRKSLLQIED